MANAHIPPFDPSAFPQVDAAIATSPYSLSSDWLNGSDENVIARIARVRWDPERDGDIVGKHLGAAIESDRAPVVRAMLAQGLPANIAWPRLFNAAHPVSSLRVALESGSAATVQALLDHGAQLTVQEAQEHPAAMWLLNQKERGCTRIETPDARAARETQVLDLLVAHRRARRPDPQLVHHAVSNGVARDTLARLLDHGLARVGHVQHHNEDGDDLLRTALHAGHARLVACLLDHGARPDPQRSPPALVQALHHPRSPKDTPARWQYRVMGMLEALAAHGLTQDLQDSTSALPHDLVQHLLDPVNPPGVPKATWKPLLRLTAAGVFPSTWWAALAERDLATVERALSIEGGLCAQWTDVRNRNALHGVIVGLGRTTPYVGSFDKEARGRLAWDQGLKAKKMQASDAIVARAPLTPEQIATAVTLVQRLLNHGLSPLRMASSSEPGALWAALDMPGEVGWAMSKALLAGLSGTERNTWVQTAMSTSVQARRSQRTLDRLVALGASLDATAAKDVGVVEEGFTALHQAVSLPWTHDRVPVLLALGASPVVLDAKGRTPMDLAQTLGGQHVDSLATVIVQLEGAMLRQTIGIGPASNAPVEPGLDAVSLGEENTPPSARSRRPRL